MAYRKTEKVLAQLEAKRAGIIAAALDVIEKGGLEALVLDNVAARAEIAVGLIYRYFPDKTELLAAAVAQLLARDLAAMREAGTLEKGISFLITRLRLGYRLMSTIGQQPAYREGIRTELARLIRATEPAESAALLAAAAYGAIFEAAGYVRPRDEATLALVVLKAIGVPVRRKAAAEVI